jgi:hypothetical protein
MMQALMACYHGHSYLRTNCNASLRMHVFCARRCPQMMMALIACAALLQYTSTRPYQLQHMSACAVLLAGTPR